MTLQSLRATLAAIDFDYESDMETVRKSSVDELFQQATIRRLRERIGNGACLALHNLNACGSASRHGPRDRVLELFNLIAFVLNAPLHNRQSLSTS